MGDNKAANAPIFAPFEPFHDAPWGAIAGLVAFALGLALAYSLYARAESDPFPRMFPGISPVALRGKFFFDEFYAEVIYFFHDWLLRPVGERSL